MKYQLDNSQIDDTPCAALYRSNIECFPPAIIGCLVMNDEWNEQALFELKQKIRADILVGVQTDNHDHDHGSLDIVEAVIKCQPDEIKDVVELLDVNAASTIIGIDVVDVINLLECGNSFQFVHASATGDTELDMVKTATHKLTSQLKKAHDTKGIFVGMQSEQSLPIEAFAYIGDAVEGLLSNTGEYIYYRSSMTDEPNSFHLKAIYIED
ncbi:hypothetical protein CXF61_03995 [Psychrobacter sp. 4Dc]|jgi:hypothetical protein|uniref:hypothetical protein n=2 Tax=unclassified Psychrobacter TaxID=196806 RepID=UPI000CB163E9|nr:hypothetical protein [Psychrobacter sp. 4Dc]PKH65903.1 hypothetical protein CXF61_03995 [Psychrobacter sp. 4Dc]